MRIILGLPIAAVVTLALFLLMKGFMSDEGYRAPEERETVQIDMLLDPNKPIEPKTGREPPDKPTTEERPKTELMDTKVDVDGGTDAGMDLDGFDPDLGPTNLPGNETAIPMLRVPPQYPSCGRNREGWVHLVFDVSETGAPINIRVLDAEPGDGCFEKAAVAALKRWKYKPAVSASGRPVVQENQEVVISFEVEG